MSTGTTRKESPAGYDHVKEITDRLDALCNGRYTEHDVFSDWVEMMLTALMGDDEAYLETADRYDRKELQRFIEAFGELQRATGQHDVDVLGDVYEAMGVNSENFDQHFTPHSVSETMSELQVTMSDGGDEPVSVCDPTCGSGRLLVSASKRLDDGVYVGQDKDVVCAKMAVVNFCLFDMTGYVVHGDTLTVDVYEAWQVQEGCIRSVDPEQAKKMLEGALA